MDRRDIERLRLPDGGELTLDWIELLIGVLQSLWPASGQNSGVLVATGNLGMTYRTSRPLVALKFFVTPSTGIPARNTSTGALGSASCQRYDLTYSGSTLQLAASSPSVSETVYNWSNSAAGNSKMCAVLEVAGYNFLLAEGC